MQPVPPPWAPWADYTVNQNARIRRLRLLRTLLDFARWVGTELEALVIELRDELREEGIEIERP